MSVLLFIVVALLIAAVVVFAIDYKLTRNLAALGLALAWTAVLLSMFGSKLVIGD